MQTCRHSNGINIAKNPIHQNRTKHVELDRHFIKEKVEGGILDMFYTPTRLQVADIPTKVLPRVKFEDLICKLGMIDIHFST